MDSPALYVAVTNSESACALVGLYAAVKLVFQRCAIAEKGAPEAVWLEHTSLPDSPALYVADTSPEPPCAFTGFHAAIKLVFPRWAVAEAGAPEVVWLEYASLPDSPALYLDVTWVNKTATRLPEVCLSHLNRWILSAFVCCPTTRCCTSV